MKAAVKTILGLQALLALAWVVPMLGMSDDNLMALQLFVMSFAPQSLFFLFGAWVLWRHPEMRIKAAIIMLLPIISFLLPVAIKSFAGGPLSGPATTAVVACVSIAVLVTAALLPQKAAVMIPKAFFRSSALNLLIVAVMVVAWVFPFASLLWLFSDYGGVVAQSMQRSNDGYVFAYLLFAGAIYAIGLAFVSLCTMIWAWIGLKVALKGGHRKLHITQMILSFPALLTGVLVVVWSVSRT